MFLDLGGPQLSKGQNGFWQILNLLLEEVVKVREIRNSNQISLPATIYMVCVERPCVRAFNAPTDLPFTGGVPFLGEISDCARCTYVDSDHCT